MKAQRRPKESGFAMLLVFVMAASVAIMLYMELPRVAFESQRNREEMLIQRGEQYTRAIQLYVRKFKKYPVKMEDLENTNQIRFLRRRYVDPMTGKDEWRLIHVGPNGQFVDSITRKPEQAKEQKAVNTFTFESQSIGATTGPGGEVQSAVPQLRESERQNLGRGALGQEKPKGEDGQEAPVGYAPAGPQYGQPQQQQQQRPAPAPTFGAPAPAALLMQPPAGQQPNANTAMPTYDSFAAPGYNPTGAIQPQNTIYGAPNAQGQPKQQQQQPQQPQNTFTGGGTFVGASPQQAGQPGQNPNQQFGGAQGNQAQPGLFSGQRGTSPTGQQQQGPNPALGMIQQILTSPRAGGPPAGLQPQGQTIGGGIAGVASKMERRGIKIYNERDSYHEWEFIYDPAQEQGQGQGQGQQAGIPGAPNSGVQGQGQAAGFSAGQTGATQPPASGSSTGTSSFVGNNSFVGGGPPQGAQPPAGQGPRPGMPNQPGNGNPAGRPFSPNLPLPGGR